MVERSSDVFLGQVIQCTLCYRDMSGRRMRQEQKAQIILNMTGKARPGLCFELLCFARRRKVLDESEAAYSDKQGQEGTSSVDSVGSKTSPYLPAPLPLANCSPPAQSQCCPVRLSDGQPSALPATSRPLRLAASLLPPRVPSPLRPAPPMASSSPAETWPVL